MSKIIFFVTLLLLIANIEGRCLKGWITGKNRCYTNVGVGDFDEARAKCGEVGAHVLSIRDHEENSFITKQSTDNTKWLGMKPYYKQDQIHWEDLGMEDSGLANYSNFAGQMCSVTPCCAGQTVDGSWVARDCKVHYQIWCYLTFEQSGHLMIAQYDELVKNATELMTQYSAEKLKSESIEKLTAVLYELKKVIKLTDHHIESGAVMISTAALFVSLFSLAVLVILRCRKVKRMDDKGFSGIKKGSFKYSHRENHQLHPEIVVGKHVPDYRKEASQLNSYENGQSRDSIDSDIYEPSTYKGLVTSQPQVL